MKFIFAFLALLFFTACKTDDGETMPDTDSKQLDEELYFPPISGNWETTTLADLNWDATAELSLDSFHIKNNTRAFIVLHKGKIVIEKYWGNNILNNGVFTENSNWYWASAGKSLTATLVGIAQEKGIISINDKVSKYLGEGWTSAPKAKEDLITIKNQLCQTTGLDYQISDWDCTIDSCLKYKVDAGTQWFYHNATYTLLNDVITSTTNISYNQFTDNEIESKIGMNGNWIASGFNNVYWSTPRDAARFGLLISNKGKWEQTDVLADMTYYNEMISSSQSLNPSYGYLWWLNGKNSIIYPTLPTSFATSLATEAPDDLFAAMGKNGQFISIVPSEDLVVIRMGEAPDNSLVPINFHNDMWKLIVKMIQ